MKRVSTTAAAAVSALSLAGIASANPIPCAPEPVCDARCPADVNGDRAITPADFSAWVAAFNANDPCADQNFDGQVTPSDFSAWIVNFNAGCAFNQPDIAVALTSSCGLDTDSDGAGPDFFETYGGITTSLTLEHDPLASTIDPGSGVVDHIVWGLPAEAGLSLSQRSIYIGYRLQDLPFVNPPDEKWEWFYRVPEQFFAPLPTGACPETPVSFPLPADPPDGLLGGTPHPLGYNALDFDPNINCPLCPLCTATAGIVAITARVVGCDAGIPEVCENGNITRACGFEVWREVFVCFK